MKKIYILLTLIFLFDFSLSSNRVQKLTDPLYNELLGEQRNPLAQNGAIMFNQTRAYPWLQPFSLQMGMRYKYEDVFRELKNDKHIIYIGFNELYDTRYNYPENIRKNGVKACVLITASTAPSTIPRSFDLPMLVDPAVQATYKTELNKVLFNDRDLVFGINLGDERMEWDEYGGIEIFMKHGGKGTYPFIDKANQEVKDQFGGGVYGIPLSFQDKTPQRWWAYRKWLYNKLQLFAEEVRGIVKGVDSNIKIVSWNGTALHQPFDYSRWKGVMDIATQQLLDSGDYHRRMFGFQTKLLADLSGVEEIWPCPHIEAYINSFDGEESLEIFSDIFRNGATGLKFCPMDGLGQFSKEYFVYEDRFADKTRWNLIKKISQVAETLPKIKQPVPDTAILYSTDTYASTTANVYTTEYAVERKDNIEFLYNFLSSDKVRAAFKFINDEQVLAGLNLSQFKIIYLPASKIQRASVIDKLENYVKQGGTLVALDPLVFNQNPLGTNISGRRKSLFGVDVTKTAPTQYIEISNYWATVYGETRYTGAFDQGLTSWATFYGDNSPAVTCKYYPNGGRAFWFAYNPCDDARTVGDGAWKRLMRAIHSSIGGRVDEKIWRFQFPDSFISKKENKEGMCLTNNYVEWILNRPIPLNNKVNSGASYWYQNADNSFATVNDTGGERWQSFSKGKLTNRMNSTKTGIDTKQENLQLINIDPYVVRFDDAKAFDLWINLNGQELLDRVELFCSGYLPEMKVYASSDGNKFECATSTVAKELGNNSEQIILNLSGLKTEKRFIKISFSSRPTNKKMVLAEMEVWSRDLVNGNCLTGNHVEWSNETPSSVGNQKINEGSYYFNSFPKNDSVSIADTKGERFQTFNTGKLTNRLARMNISTVKGIDEGNIYESSVRWSQQENIDLIVNLNEYKNIDRFVLYYSGYLPKVKIYGSIDGISWSMLSESDYVFNESNNIKKIWKLNPESKFYRFIKVAFDQRPQGISLWLNEFEVWSR